MIELKHLIKEQTDIRLGYHVTFKHLLPKIKKEGLIPKIPKDMDDVKAVYLFKSIDDAENALYNWLGELIEMEEELGRTLEEITLEVNITGLNCIDSVEYEWICVDHINPNRIIRVIDL